MAIKNFRSVITLLSLISAAVAASLTCTTESQPNPIAGQYPNDVTGTINGTTALIPIPYSVARSMIPSQYGILTKAYQSLIPNLPPNTFPAFLEAVLDHDVQMSGLGIPDFQVCPSTSVLSKVRTDSRLESGYFSPIC